MHKCAGKWSNEQLMGAMGTHFDVVKQLLENAPTPVSTDSCAACGTKLGVQSLNMKASYARNWGAKDGIRELVQNFFDKVDVGWESRQFCVYACVCVRAHVYAGGGGGDDHADTCQ